MVRTIQVLMLCYVLSGASAVAAENPDYRHFMQRGRDEYNCGHFGASEPFFLTALRTLQPPDQAERAVTLTQLGDVYMNEDELSKAEHAYRESLAIYKQLSDTTKTALVLRNLGAIYSLERRDDDALQVLQQSLKLTRADPAGNAALTAQVLNSVGIVYYRQGKTSKAENLFKQALQMVETSGVPFDTAELLNNLGSVYYAKHKFHEAEDLLKQALTITETGRGPMHPDLTFTLAALGMLYTETGRYSEAEDQFQRVLKILEPGKLDFDTRIARVLHTLSVTYTKAGRKTDADTALAQAAVIARRNLRQHADMAAIVEDYAAILKTRGNIREAEELRAEAVHARVAAGLVINAHNPF